jgi:16S rRNA processing protein RimM
VLFLEGIENRSQAETLIKAILLIEIDLDKLPEEPEAWYDHQLLGLEALVENTVVGKVIRVDHLPAQDLLAIETTTGEVLVPFVKQIVPTVDISKGQIILDPPAGLFELNLAGGDTYEN